MTINEFEGKYRFLSNFYPSMVEFDGERYPTIEHAYQAAKYLDPDKRSKIRLAATPTAAKKLGRAKTGFRPDWDSVKIGVMRDLISQKFRSGTELATKLTDTRGVELIEGNWWGDKFWGVCKGVGENHLGKLLMEQREKLLSEWGV
jgi:ribA/ribD-fused uncharacterized protein